MAERRDAALSGTKVGISADVAKRFGQKVLQECQFLYLVHISSLPGRRKEQKNMPYEQKL